MEKARPQEREGEEKGEGEEKSEKEIRTERSRSRRSRSGSTERDEKDSRKRRAQEGTEEGKKKRKAEKDRNERHTPIEREDGEKNSTTQKGGKDQTTEAKKETKGGLEKLAKQMEKEEERSVIKITRKENKGKIASKTNQNNPQMEENGEKIGTRNDENKTKTPNKEKQEGSNGYKIPKLSQKNFPEAKQMLGKSGGKEKTKNRSQLETKTTDPEKNKMKDDEPQAKKNATVLPKDQTKTTSAEKPNPTRDQPTNQPAKPISINDKNKEENPSKKKDKEKEKSPDNSNNMGKPKENPTNTNDETKQEEKSKQSTKHRDGHADENESNGEITNHQVSPVVGRGRKRRESSDEDELPPTPSVSPRNSPKDDYPAPESKYFASAKVGENICDLLVDTGAGASLLTPFDARNLEKIKLRKPIKLKGFSGSIDSICHSYVIVNVDFSPGKTQLKFMIADVPVSIIGVDNLKSLSTGLSLETASEEITVRGWRIKTEADEATSRAAYFRRRRNNDVGDGGLSACLRLREDIRLPVGDIQLVPGFVGGGRRLTGELIFYSLYDKDNIDLFVPNTIFDGDNNNYVVPMQNRSNNELHLKAGTILGRIWSQDLSVMGVSMEIHEISSVLKQIYDEKTHNHEENHTKTMTPEVKQIPTKPSRKRDKWKKLKAKWKKDKQTRTVSRVQTSEITDKPTIKEEAGRDPVKFTDLAGNSEVDDETLQRAFKNGVMMNVYGKSSVPEAELEAIPNLDVEEEKKKHLNDKWWPNSKRKEFEKQFNVAHLDKETADEILRILWAFKNCFDSGNPDHFKEGMNVKPVEMNLLPGMRPQKVKMRETSKDKEAYMKKHLELLLSQGVIEELQSSEGCFISPAHIVLERRYIASTKQTITKSRLVIDLRSVNKCMAEYVYPLPLTKVFRRELARGFRYFSTFDGSSFYHQIKISSSTSRLCVMFALNKIYAFRRLCMGAASSPSIVSAIGNKMFECHPNAKQYLDDWTIRSKTIRRHLDWDLPRFLAIISFYRILLKGSKSDLLVSSTRVLGHEIGNSSLALTAEKMEKIKELSFPTTKKALISTLAFFAYFLILSPRLSELLAPMRKFAGAKVRYQPDDETRKSFEEAKQHLLSPEVGAIRTPSPDIEDDVFMFTDASSNALSAILTQKQYESDERTGPKRLYIIGVWSGTVPKTSRTLPIWISELYALYSASLRWASFLLPRRYVVISDSSTILNWTNLDLIPNDLARRIIFLQRFKYKILWVKTVINPADVFSRQDGETAPEGTYPSFAAGRIVNAQGDDIPLEKLFSREKRVEMEKFFGGGERRQPMSRPVAPKEMERHREKDRKEEERQLGGLAEKVETADSEIVECVEGIPEEAEFSPEFDAREVTLMAMAIGDDDIKAGRTNDEDEELPDNSLKEIKIPPIEKHRKKEVESWQKDTMVKQIKEYLEKDLPQPTKYEAMALPVEIKHFLNHRSLFRLENNVVYRLWVDKEGNVNPLIVLGESALHETMRKIHQDTHAGFRPMFKMISNKFYAFHLRKKVQTYVASCPSCILNNHPITTKVKTGSQLATLPNEVIVMDFLGPLNNFKTSTGKAKYVLVMIDSHSRYLHAFECKSTKDEELLKCVIALRNRLSGLPKRISVDGALIKKNTETAKYLKNNGVEILHGSPHISRHQSKAERVISSLSRMIAKFSTENPKMKLEELIEMATVAHNCMPHKSLPRNMAPKDVHFTCPPSTFHDVTKQSNAGGELLKNALAATEEVWKNEIKSYLRGRKRVSPTDHSSRLRIGQLCMKKRTTFLTTSPRKYQHKRTANAYKITRKIATNVFEVKSIIDNTKLILPGDHLIQMKHHNKESLTNLIREIEALTSGGHDQPKPMKLRSRQRLEKLAMKPRRKAQALMGVDDDADRGKTETLTHPRRRSARLKQNDS